MKSKHRPKGMLVKIDSLIDDAKCFETVRNIKGCHDSYDDLAGTIFEGRHQPLLLRSLIEILVV